MNLTRADLRLIQGALRRAIDHEETSAQCWENDIEGYVLPDAAKNIATSRALVAEYRALQSKVSGLLKRPVRAKAGK